MEYTGLIKYKTTYKEISFFVPINEDEGFSLLYNYCYKEIELRYTDEIIKWI